MEHLRPYCTERQLEILEAVIRTGSHRNAAKQLQCNRSYVSRAIRAVEKKAAFTGDYPEAGLNSPAAPGFGLMGYSDMRTNEEGKPVWYKFSREKEEREKALREFVEGLQDEVPRAKPRKESREKYRDDLMPGIFIGDAHIGMRAYGKETKHDDFDTDIAIGQLRDASDYLVSRMEPAETGLLVDVGDYTHANGQHNKTFAGTDLDVDTRHRSTMYHAAMTMRYMIDAMLTKCKKVVVVIAKGNHNEDVAPAIELMLSFYYEREPRVKVLETHGHYHYVEYGKWLLGVTHGDKQRPEMLAGSMARDMAEAWGRTTHRMWCSGHFHKEAVKTLPGVKHKVFGALPPPDAWHASHGYAGDGEMEMLTFRKSGGLHSSFVYNIPRPIIEPDVKI